MVIDINWLRVDKGGDPDSFKESEKRRGRTAQLIDDIQAADKEWIRLQAEVEQRKAQLNKTSKEIGAKKKANKDDPCEAEKSQVEKLKGDIADGEKKAMEAQTELQRLLHRVGNKVHDSVPTSTDEANNAVVRSWGTPWKWGVTNTTTGANPHGWLKHHEMLSRLGCYEQRRGVAVSGHRGYYLKTPGVLLNQALINYGLAFLMKKGYSLLQPPYFMKKEIMAKTAELADFNETLYKIPGEQKGSKQEDGTPDAFLIATSEQPISAYHMNEFIEPEKLPFRYGGLSTCFRKEAGSHGKEAHGLFRIHQFEKVEQFCITSPEKSWEMHDEMMRISEEFYQSLNLPYRVVAIVSGALNDAAARKYDLEAWFPSFDDFRELVSCSNCTDFQSRDLEIRHGYKKGETKLKSYVHMLNGTLCATQRCMSCIAENYQTQNGMKVPSVLVPFMGGIEFLPFVCDADAEATEGEAASISAGKQENTSAKANQGKQENTSAKANQK